MLDPIGVARHVVVGASVLAAPALVMMGVLGGGVHEERFDAKQVLVTPAGGDGIRIREVVDQDFGTNDRHGYQRYIPNDFGAPIDIEATSPDADSSLDVSNSGFQTRLRIGDPDTTYSGQHRYILEYTLPEARLSTGRLGLDIIGTDEEFETGRFEVVVSGFVLDDIECSVGGVGDSGGCMFQEDRGVYRVVIEPLEAGEGITIGGDIVEITEPRDVARPAIPDRRDASGRQPLAIGALGLGVAAGAGGFVVARRLGRNEVGGTGAADAAYATAGGTTRLVADADLGDLATTEFEPPRDIRPYQGRMLLTERVDFETVGAWFGDQIAQEFLELRGTDQQTLLRGRRLNDAPPDVQQRVTKLFAAKDELELGKYQPTMAKVWADIRVDQILEAKRSGWWSRFAPGQTARFPALLGGVVLGAVAVIGIGALLGLLRTWPVALVIGFALPAIVAGAAYRRLLPVRSAAGSALALRTESFRRFLIASEGKHVEWAWRNGLLREYTAWAVALGAADAWGRAMADSTVPPPELRTQTSPMLMATHWAVWQSTRSAPSTSSGSSGGGGFSSGFSGGSVGGGGGGGSSGSW